MEYKCTFCGQTLIEKGKYYHCPNIECGVFTEDYLQGWYQAGEHIAALTTRLQEAEEIIKISEWCIDEWGLYCPICGEYKENGGHMKDCRAAAWLKGDN